MRLSLSALLICLTFNSFAHEDNFILKNDSLPKDTLHSPKKAALYSALLPSAGQFYNKKYWKMPVVYAGLGAGIYFIIDNHQKFQFYKSEYLKNLDGQTTDLSSAQNFALQDQHHSWRDYSILFTGVFYALQIVDAAVDAHFFYFEEKINPDLSFRIQPTSMFTGFSQSAGLSFKLNF